MAYARLPFSMKEAERLQAKPPKPQWLCRERKQHAEIGKKLCSYDYWLRLYEATPWWVCKFADEIYRLYRDCPAGMEIDHEVPLRHPLVCGLHVPWNLRAIEKDANQAKSNHWWPDCPHEPIPLFEQHNQPHQMRLMI